MSHFFIPGKVIGTFTTKSGKIAEVRYPQWETLSELLKYINTLSAEDTFITFSGEQLTHKEEAEYLASVFVQMDLGHGVWTQCYINNELVGVCEVSRANEQRERTKHVAKFGLTIKKEFRQDGIGFNLAHLTIENAKEHVQDLRIIFLLCFAENQAALKLYHKLGFKEVGRIPKMLYRKGEYSDEIEMIKEI
jgi:RimJ/RimL family protein N-acetyltransferase